MMKNKSLQLNNLHYTILVFVCYFAGCANAATAKTSPETSPEKPTEKSVEKTAKTSAIQSVGISTKKFEIKKLADRVSVKIDGQLFTEYLYGSKRVKPILWPMIGPTGQNLVRNYPLRKKVKGEEYDHPHHEGLWFAHMPINGVNFWHFGGAYGKQILDKLIRAEVENDSAVIEATHNWVDSKGKIICTDHRVIRFSMIGSSRVIDYDITLIASHGELKIGDNKEGTMAIRTHPALRVTGKPKKSIIAKGHAINSEGDKDKKLWGKNAKWVDYWAPINGQTVGVAIFDHPQNLRHPTTWHARTYGLITANPFGLHYFKRQPKNAGDFTIKQGQQQRFRYRFVFHKGDANQARIKQMYQQWATK